MDRIYSFASSPAMLPEEVIEKANKELQNYAKTGLSVMEITRGSAEYAKLFKACERSLRKLMSIPNGYKVMFMNSGSGAQYSAVPMNLLSEHKCADYIVSGHLSKIASLEAKNYGDIAICASSAGATPAFSTVPETKRSDFRPDADYVYVCMNNPVYGTKFHYIPDTGNIPLVADMSSFMLSEPVNVSKFGMIFASFEQGLGPEGLTVVIIRDDLARAKKKGIPLSLDYRKVLDNEPGANTASAWSVYMAKLIFDWMISLGGLEEIKRKNERKASCIYDYLDSQTYYTSPVDKKCRSLMNVIFVTGVAELDKKFAEEADAIGLKNLGGNGALGGLCASLYNSVPIEAVLELVEFMKRFAQENPKIEM